MYIFKGLGRRPRHEGAGAAADLEETATSNAGGGVGGGGRGPETGLAGGRPRSQATKTSGADVP